MADLPRDRRGLPIPVIVLVDERGRPHFTVNDSAVVSRMIDEDRCAICAKLLHRGRWYVGGPLSVDQTMIPERPGVFVAVMALGHDIGGLAPSGTPYLKPRRPYRDVEFRRHGTRMDEAVGKRLAMEAVAASTIGA